MKPILITKNKNNIIFTAGVEEMVYKTDINSFVENTGITIQNISFPLYGYYVRLSDFSTTFVCGNILENLFIELKKNDIENSLIVVDFKGVEELSNSFYQSYTKILLETSNKIITINMNTGLSNEFSSFIISNILEKPEEEEEEWTILY